MSDPKNTKLEELTTNFQLPNGKTLNIVVTENNRFYLKCGDKISGLMSTDEYTAFKMAQAVQWALGNLA